MPYYTSVQTTSSNSKSQGCSISVDHIGCSSLWDYPEDISDHPHGFTFHKGRGKENIRPWSMPRGKANTAKSNSTGVSCTYFCVHMKQSIFLSSRNLKTTIWNKFQSFPACLTDTSSERCTSPTPTCSILGKGGVWTDFFWEVHNSVLTSWPSVCINKWTSNHFYIVMQDTAKQMPKYPG